MSAIEPVIRQLHLLARHRPDFAELASAVLEMLEDHGALIEQWGSYRLAQVLAAAAHKGLEDARTLAGIQCLDDDGDVAELLRIRLAFVDEMASMIGRLGLRILARTLSQGVTP